MAEEKHFQRSTSAVSSRMDDFPEIKTLSQLRNHWLQIHVFNRVDHWCFLLCILFISGIQVVLPDGVKTKSKVMALSGHFDLPARSGVLEQVTYVGHDSCCYCNEHGDVIKVGVRGHVMTFPIRNTASGHAKLRTAEEVQTHSFDALEMDTSVSCNVFYI